MKAVRRPTALARRVTVASVGNHAIAAAHAGKILGTAAKAAMTKTAGP